LIVLTLLVKFACEDGSCRPKFTKLITFQWDTDFKTETRGDSAKFKNWIWILLKNFTNILSWLFYWSVGFRNSSSVRDRLQLQIETRKVRFRGLRFSKYVEFI